MSLNSPVGRFAVALSVGLASVGCNTTSGAKSWLPWSGTSTASADAMGSTTGSLSDTSRGITGQWNSMTSAAGSALQKTKTAVTGAFSTATPSDKQDPTSVNTKIESIGPEVYVAYGQVCESTGKFVDAADNYTKALAIAPTNAPALASMARLHDRQNLTNEAVDYYQKAIAASPNDAQLYSDLGMLYSRSGKIEEASKKLEQAIAIRPSEAKYHSNLAAIHLDSGHADQAMATLQKVNTPAAANYNMALLHVQRNQLQNAQQHLTTALQHDPNMQPARELLTKIGGPQALQQTVNAYQTASTMYQGVRNLTNTTPAGAVGPAISQATPAGYPQMQPGSYPQTTNLPPATMAPNGSLPSLPYVPSLEAGRTFTP